MSSAAQIWREVTPGLWAITESTEKSTGRRPYGAMRRRNTPITASAARRAL